MFSFQILHNILLLLLSFFFVGYLNKNTFGKGFGKVFMYLFSYLSEITYNNNQNSSVILPYFPIYRKLTEKSYSPFLSATYERNLFKMNELQLFYFNSVIYSVKF